jgi:hypothetical protein
MGLLYLLPHPVWFEAQVKLQVSSAMITLSKGATYLPRCYTWLRNEFYAIHLGGHTALSLKQKYYLKRLKGVRHVKLKGVHLAAVAV